MRQPVSGLTRIAFVVQAAMLLGGAVGVLGMAAPAAYAQAEAPSARHDVKISAGTLGQALNAFAAATGVELTADGDLVAGRSSRGLAGSFTVQEGFQLLLSEHSLQAVRAANGSYALRKVANVGSVPTTLAPLTVTARSLRDGVTEGTGSYTTDSSRTATGLSLSLRDTPQSVTVITRQRMDDQAMGAVEEALRASIGVSVKATDRGRNSLSARGFDLTNFQIDGVPTESGNVGLETTSTVIYDRVEIVRGPTGLLNGAGDPSATANLVRKHAHSQTFAGSVGAEFGSWDHLALTADLSTPLNASGSVRARFVAHGMKENSFIDLESRRTSVFYGVIDVDLTPATQLSMGLSQQNDKRDGVYWGGLSYWYADGTRTDWPRSKTTAANWNKWDTKDQTAFATLTHSLAGGWQLRADASYRKQTEESNLLWMNGRPDRATGVGYDSDPYYYYTKPRQTQLSVSASGPYTLWGREHELMVGVSRSRLKDGWLTADPQNAAPVGDFNHWDGSYPEPVYGPVYLASSGRTTQTSAYLATRIQLADSLKLILGGRLTDWERDEGDGAWTASPYTMRERRVFTPYGGLVYDLNQNYSVYASYTKIFKPQTSSRDRYGEYLDPLEGKGLETGLKGEFFDGRLNASAAVFRIEQDNLAVPDTGYFVPGTGMEASRAAKGTKSQGLELEVAGELAPGWELGAGWTKFSARDAQGENVSTRHARTQFKLFSKYRFEGSLAGLAIGGGVVWQSASPFTFTNPVTGNSERVGQGAYALVDLMASYQIGRQTRLQLNVKNLFDKKYYENSTASFTYGVPRSAMLRVQHEF